MLQCTFVVLFIIVDAGSSQVEYSVTTRQQELDLNQRTYLELIEDYETINEEPHYHEIADRDEQGRQTARVLSV